MYKVVGHGQLDKKKFQPLFKIDFDKSSLKGDFYIEDSGFYPKTKIGNF